MKNISLEIVKVSYSGEFYLKATLDMVIYIYIYIYRSAVTTIPIYIKTFQINVSDQILKDGIQFIVKYILQCFKMLDRIVKFANFRTSS